jgi:hypothetical protein
MKSAYISGDLGDLTYSLAAVKELGIEKLYLNVNPKYKIPRVGETKFNEKAAMALMPLIQAQPYIKEVALYDGEPVDYNLDLFRLYGDLTWTNLCYIILKTFGCDTQAMNRQWLFVEPKKMEKIVLINKTDRYLNPEVDWTRFIEAYGDYMAFVGLESEYKAFIEEFKVDIPHYATKDFLELAQLIAGCSIFIGNQSSPYAIAEGLKVDTIQVVCDQCPNCLFERPNAYYEPNKYMIKRKI